MSGRAKNCLTAQYDPHAQHMVSISKKIKCFIRVKFYLFRNLKLEFCEIVVCIRAIAVELNFQVIRMCFVCAHTSQDLYRAFRKKSEDNRKK